MKRVAKISAIDHVNDGKDNAMRGNTHLFLYFYHKLIDTAVVM